MEIGAKRIFKSARFNRGRHIMRILRDARGTELVEAALVLPFLLVFAVGTWDFGGAYHLKAKLNNAAREGARFAASESPLDLSGGASTPPSVTAVRDVVANYLSASNLACTVGTSAAYTPTNLGWSYSSPSAGCGAFSLTIERGYPVLNGANTVVSSRVTVTYPYSWTFNKVIGLLVSGSGPALPTTVTTNAIMANED